VEIVELMSAWKIVDGKHGRTAWASIQNLFFPERGASTEKPKRSAAVCGA